MCVCGPCVCVCPVCVRVWALCVCGLMSPNTNNGLVGLVVNASASRAADLGSLPPCAVDLCPGQVIPLTSTLLVWWLPCKVLGVIGSALGLVSPVSVYCVWVR